MARFVANEKRKQSEKEIKIMFWCKGISSVFLSSVMSFWDLILFSSWLIE
jgi:hypothetical protein